MPATNTLILEASLFDNINIFHIVSFALVNGLFTPALGLLQGAHAKNKVEGFALIKGTGMLALVPALMILETFQGGLQFVLGIFPNFWAIRGMLHVFMLIESKINLSYPIYLLIGSAYSIILLIAAYRFFLKKLSTRCQIVVEAKLQMVPSPLLLRPSKTMGRPGY